MSAPGIGSHGLVSEADGAAGCGQSGRLPPGHGEVARVEWKGEAIKNE